MVSIKKNAILRYEWHPQVFSSLFSLIASTLSLEIDNNEPFFAIQKSWKKYYIEDKNIRFSSAPI